MNRSTPFFSDDLTLPFVNGLVGFTGKLHSLEENVEQDSDIKLRATVYVETISNLTQLNDDGVPKRKTAVSDSFEDKDTVALKSRFRKYAEQSNIEESKVATAGKDAHVGTSKGKRKLTLTFDSLGRDKADRGDHKRR